MKLTHLKERLERFESLEEKYGLEIKSISFTQQYENAMSCFIEVYGGQLLKGDVTINVVIYDIDGDIVSKENTSLFADDFNGFDVLEMYFSDIDIDNIGKIRIYPTL